MNLVEQVRAAGVVGAGGGGFPTHLKLSGTADTVIANGAECEPLLHKDAAVMELQANEVIRGMQLAMAAVKASQGIIGIKAKNRHAIASISAAAAGSLIRVHPLRDVYPAGDEFDLVFETTGRLIPAGGIPLHIGAVVCNVETFANIAAARDGRPVTHKTLTVAGAVREPRTFTVPLGVTLAQCVAAAGGATVEDTVVCLGGIMMGETTRDLQRPVTKTTGGILVLPSNHPVIARKLKPADAQRAVGKSACDQCRYCTELCPRYLLGYEVEPHQVMRSLAFTATGERAWHQLAAQCCACGLCTLYSCPEQLFPKEACDVAKRELRKAGIPVNRRAPRLHGMREGRKVPISSLMKRLSLTAYEHPAPYASRDFHVRELVLPLKQNAGVPGKPAVRTGQSVSAGTPLSELVEQAPCARVHAPLAGTVVAVDETRVLLRVN